MPARKNEVVSVYADYQHFAEVFPGIKFPDYDNLIELFGTLPDQPVSSPIDYNSDLDSVRAIGSENARIISKQFLSLPYFLSQLLLLVLYYCFITLLFSLNALPYPILSYLILSYLILSYLILSYLLLPYLVIYSDDLACTNLFCAKRDQFR